MCSERNDVVRSL